MPFERPTLSELIDRVKADAESRCGKQTLRWSVLGVLVRVIAGVAHGLYGFIAFVLRQIFSSTAEGEYLERRASEYGITRRPAAAAVGTVTFTGEGSVPAQTRLQNQAGTVYVTTEASAESTAPITAEQAGAAGNAEEGMELTLVSPVEGVQSTAIAGELSGGADPESDESLRERLLERQKTPPRAGTKEDYVAWAKEVPGVTRAWCYPMELGPGRVTVRFMTDGMTENGIPSSQMIETVEDHIEGQMPVTVILAVVAPQAKPLSMTLDILPDTEEARAKIKSAIEQVILNEAAPGGPVLLSSLSRAVGSVSEVSSFRIVTPTDDVTTTTGQILVPGEITYQ